jgi:hypothetical protein
MVTQPSALVIISGVHDTCIARAMSALRYTRHAGSDLLDEALEVNIKQAVHLRIVIVVSSASFDAQNIVPACIIDVFARDSCSNNSTCQDVTIEQSGKGRDVYKRTIQRA